MIGQRTPATYDQRNRPTGYVGGVGRGAVGFTTRSDIGPARPGIGADSGRQFGAAPTGYVAGAGRGATGLGDSGSVGLMGSVPGAGISGTAVCEAGEGVAVWRAGCGKATWVLSVMRSLLWRVEQGCWVLGVVLCSVEVGFVVWVAGGLAAGALCV